VKPAPESQAAAPVLPHLCKQTLKGVLELELEPLEFEPLELEP